MNKKTTKKLLILKGEGRHEHVLVGEEITYVEPAKGQPLSEIHVGRGGLLTHIDPATGEHAEHNTISVDEGTWLVGRQVEFNPFDNSISNVFD